MNDTVTPEDAERVANLLAPLMQPGREQQAKALEQALGKHIASKQANGEGKIRTWRDLPPML